MTDSLEAIWINYAREGRCPHCLHGDLVAGPWGGMSRNVYCPTCMIRWNLHGVPYGIIAVDFEGNCAQQDIASAQARYPDEQPFALKAK